MKNILLLLFLGLNLSFSQSTEETITTDFNQIIEYTRQKNMDKVLDMTYPRLFDVYPKEMLAGMATGMLESMGIKTIYEDNQTNLMISPLKNIANIKTEICIGKYNQNMILEFNDENAVKFFTQNPIDGYTIEIIDSKKIRMLGVSYLLAIKDSYSSNTWKYMNYDIELSNPVHNPSIVHPDIITETKKLIATF